MMMISHTQIGLKLCSWNANGILNKISEFKIFVEKYSPDLVLLQETHLRPSHTLNIPNYIRYRNDFIGVGRARGGTLILVKRNIYHYNVPTTHLQHIEATTVVITPKNLNPIAIITVYIPPTSDDRLFTQDLEYFLQANSNCVIFGDFNATHNMWNCPNNSIRGCRLKAFVDTHDLTIAHPDSPTRFGHRSANILDFAIINNFHYPFTVNSLAELSSDHNPVLLNFSFTPPIHHDNHRAITTCWSSYKNNLNSTIRLEDYAGINNPDVLEEKIQLFTSAVRSAHQHASQPIENTKHPYTPIHIHDLVREKNRAKKLYHNTLNPAHKTQYYRLQEKLKKELKKHNQQMWQNKLEALNTRDNSLWQCQKFFRKKRTNIPSLSSSSGVANSDDQKANILALTLKDNFAENKRPGNGSHPIDKEITNTLEKLFTNPPSPPLIQ
ncbi:probable RNA-directed DNA polymerase from transposon X-element [Trichonephila clavipes]|nr:probable RNA-directed DNA polymerase from transposon X-element [Trichonephila clavipes]